MPITLAFTRIPPDYNTIRLRRHSDLSGPPDCRSAAASASHRLPKNERSRARSGQLERRVGWRGLNESTSWMKCSGSCAYRNSVGIDTVKGLSQNRYGCIIGVLIVVADHRDTTPNPASQSLSASAMGQAYLAQTSATLHTSAASSTTAPCRTSHLRSALPKYYFWRLRRK
jgi:hypothetical protein